MCYFHLQGVFTVDVQEENEVYLRVNCGDQMSWDSEQGFSSLHPFNLWSRVLRWQVCNHYCTGFWIKTACICKGTAGCLVSKGPLLYTNDWFCVAVVTKDILPNRSAYGPAAFLEKSISSLLAASIQFKPYKYKSKAAWMNSAQKPLAELCRPVLGEMTSIVLMDCFSTLIAFHSHLIRKLVRPQWGLILFAKNKTFSQVMSARFDS